MTEILSSGQVTTTPPLTPVQGARILRMPAVLNALGVCRSTVYNYLNPESDQFIHDFPTPVRLGLGERAAIGWHSDEFEDWVKSRPRAVRKRR